jgi:hypothetical protein
MPKMQIDKSALRSHRRQHMQRKGGPGKSLPQQKTFAQRYWPLIVLSILASALLAWPIETVVHRSIYSDLISRTEEAMRDHRSDPNLTRVGVLVSGAYDAIKAIEREHPIWTFLENYHILYGLFPALTLAIWLIVCQTRKTTSTRPQPSQAADLVSFACPHCNTALQAPVEQLSGTIECPSCQNQIEIEMD